MKKEILIGFLASIFVTSCGLFLFLEYISDLDFMESLKRVKASGVLGKIIFIASIPNFFLFFIFYKRQEDYRARGVVIGLISFTIIIFVLKFI